jgi:hypothetical protein
MPVLTRTRPGRRAWLGLGVGRGFLVARGVGVGVGRGVAVGPGDGIAAGEAEVSGASPIDATPSGHGSAAGEVAGRWTLGPGIPVALSVGRAELAGEAPPEGWTLAEGAGLAPMLGLGVGRQSGRVDGLALAWAALDDADGEADAPGVPGGVAASPVRVTTSTRPHAPRTAAHTGRR